MTDQSVSRKNQIMEAARELFAEKGYYEVKMGEVADAVGVAKGTLYLYFKSKADLFVQVFTMVLDSVISDLREILNSGEDLSTTLTMMFKYFENSIRGDSYFNRFGEMHHGNCGNLSLDLAREVKQTIFFRIQALENDVVNFLATHLPDSKLNLRDLYQLLVAISVEISRSESNTIKDTALSLILNGTKKEAT